MKSMRILLFVMCPILIFQAAYSGSIALFSPDDKPTLKLIDLIKSARISINAAVYMFSDKTIAEELIAAHKRGVKVKILVDRISASDYGKAKLLHDNGIPVSVFYIEEKKAREEKAVVEEKIYEKPKVSGKHEHHEHKEDPKFFNNSALMHNKFMVIDHKLLWTGSFNWSVAANKRNQENIVILDDKNLCTQFENHFTKILTERCKPFASKQPVPVLSPLQEKINQLIASSPDDVTLMNNLIGLVAEFKPKLL